MVTSIQKTWLCDICKVTQATQSNINIPTGWASVSGPGKLLDVCPEHTLDSITYQQILDARPENQQTQVLQQANQQSQQVLNLLK